MNLLFINALKGLKSKKIQMIGIISLVTLSISIYTAMNTALDRLDETYLNYLITQNVEDFAFTPIIDFQYDYTNEEVEELKQTYLKDIPEDQMNLVNQYQMTLGMDGMEELHQAIEYIFNINGATENKIKEIENCQIQSEQSKVIKEENTTIKAMPYYEKQINIPYLVDGKFPENDDEITLLPDFLTLNNLKIGDLYTISDKQYKIVGTAYAPDHIYPLIAVTSPIFNAKNNTIIYTTEEEFQNFIGTKEFSYVAAFDDEEKLLDFEQLQELFKESEDIKLDMTAALRLMRINAIQAQIETDRTFSGYFLWLLLGISIFIIVVVTKKRIEDERLQIGVLKSLGYNKVQIATSYLVYPVIGAIIGSIIGFTIGILIHYPLANLIKTYYNLPIENYQITIKYLIETLTLTTLTLSILSFLISIFMLRKKPLELLKEGSNLKVNLLSKLTHLLTKKMSFKNRFRYSLASRSTGKLFIVSLTAFATGLLIVLILIGSSLFTNMISSTFTGLNFQNMISYITPLDDSSDSDDLLYNTSKNLIEIIKEDGTTINPLDMTKKEEYQITLTGIDTNLKNFEILNENKELINSPQNQEIIINTNIQARLDLQINDTLVIQINEELISLKIIDIDNSFMGETIYINREYITTKVEGKLVYNTKYTNDEKYNKLSSLEQEEVNNISSIFSLEDLKRNMDDMLASSSAVIYIVIIFASIMALVIITVIANVVIEENKRTISLMKVMGYDNKEISKIVLNIYTPFVIIAYFIAIPVMINLLNFIVKILTQDMDFTLPIQFSFIKALIGLLGLLISYFIAILLSKRSLNKVPLAIALKRE